MTLSEHIGLADAGDLPPALGRTAYRVVQEGLTNARKHAPGQPVRITMAGEPGGRLVIDIRNPTATVPSTLPSTLP